MSGRPKGSRGGAGVGSASPDHGRGDGASRSRPAGVANVAQAHEITAGTARAGRAGSAGGTAIRDAGSYGEFRLDFPRGSDFVGAGYSQRAAEAYRRIRNSPEDTPLVAANTGIDPRIVEGMRQNLFVQQHNIALGPNRVERGYFTPDDDIAHQWEGAVRGTLDPDQVGEFRNLAAHEYVENRLMEAGLPYRSSHPASYDADGDHMPHPDHPGAHELAPHEWRPESPLEHWRMFGIDSSGLEMAPDLSNLDEIVDAALRGLGR